MIPGNEGSGLAVRSGGGLIARSLVNKRVAFTRLGPGGMRGTYAEYAVIDAKKALAISDKSVDFDHACNSFVNPLTAIGLLDTLKTAKAKYAVHTGAASQLARMMMRLAPEYGITFINVVRRDEQVKMLKEEYKQQYVLNSSDEKFFDELKDLTKSLEVRHCLECVGGAFTGRLISRLPNNSTTWIYGCLCKEPFTALDPRNFIYQGHKVEGWILFKWLAKKNLFQKYFILRKVNKLLSTTFRSVIAARFGLHETLAAIKHYDENMTEGKVIMKPTLIPEHYTP